MEIDSMTFADVPYLLAPFAVCSALAGCTVGPNYKRPSVDVPGCVSWGCAGRVGPVLCVSHNSDKPHRLRSRWVTRSGGRSFRIPNCRI